MLYNINELRDFVNRTVTNYFYISRDDNLDYLLPETDEDGLVQPVVLLAYDYQGRNKLKPDFLTPQYLGIFA